MSRTNRPFRRPEQQGKVDGMCAVYAAINSAKLLFGHDEKQDAELFKHVCDSCPELFPKIVYEGTGVPGLRKIFKATADWVRGRQTGYELRFTSPLMRVPRRPLDGYFEHLQLYLSSESKMASLDSRFPGVWVVGLNTPWDHWTCVRDVSDRLVYFYDSYGMRRYRRDSFTLNKADAGEGPGKKILIDYHQSFWVYKSPASAKISKRTKLFLEAARAVAEDDA